LMPLESDGAVVVNRPSSALNCHRYRLVKRLGDSTLSFPRTLILASSAPLSPEQVDAFYPDDRKVWIKRGDVHAERPEDVVATSRSPSPIAPCSSTSTTGRASRRSVTKRREPLPTMSLIGSHTGNTRDPYNPQDSGSRPQVEGPVRPRGVVSRSRDPERSAIQPALDRSRRRRRVVRW